MDSSEWKKTNCDKELGAIKEINVVWSCTPVVKCCPREDPTGPKFESCSRGLKTQHCVC